MTLLLVIGMGLAWTPPALADNCQFCQEPIEKGINPLKCPSCIKKADEIVRKREYQVTKTVNDRTFNLTIRPSRKVWLLDFKRKKLGQIQIKNDTGTPERYWYLAYSITNKDKYPHRFFLTLRGSDDRTVKRKKSTMQPALRLDDHARDLRVSPKHLRRFHYHDTFVPEVYKALQGHLKPWLKQKEGGYDKLRSKIDVSMPAPGSRNVLPQAPKGGSFPFDSQAIDKRTAKIALPTIQPGETWKCVAIFQALNPQMDRLIVSVRGLTNFSLLKKDAYARPSGKPHRRVIKEAVLELHYARPGDEFTHHKDRVRFLRRKWVDVRRVLKSDLASQSK